VTRFAEGDITTNGTVSNFQTVSAQVYTADITPSGQGAVTVSVAQGVCTSVGTGVANQASNQLSITYDSVGPTPTISSAESSPTAANPVVIDIDFNEAVTGFAIGDIQVSGTANATLQNFSGSGQNYQVEAVPESDGTILIDVDADVCTDAAG